MTFATSADRLELALGAQRDRLAVALHLAAGHVEVLGGQLGRHLRERQAERFEPPRIEVDLDLADLAAVHLHRGHAVDLLEQRLQVVLDLAAGDSLGWRRADREDHDRQGPRRRTAGWSDPRCRGGSRARIAATFSRTSAAAACGSTSSRSSTPTREKPSVEVEITRLTPLMPATASSIGWVTSDSTSSGAAPG